MEAKRSEAPVMDLYDLFGYTQEERRMAERGLKPERKKGGKPKRKKQQEQSLFSPVGTGTDRGEAGEKGEAEARTARREACHRR